MIQLTVRTMTDALRKNGEKYWKADTTEGHMSIFEKDVHDAIYPHLNRSINVTVTERGQYKNITAVAKALPDNDPMPVGNSAGKPDNELMIVRQCCLKVAAKTGITAEDAAATIEKAKLFVDWVYS